MSIRGKYWFWASLTAALLATRLAHINILWADEDYHLAAAIQVLEGKALYRDLWYDKPPLNALLLAAYGAWPGWPLRILSTVLAVAGSAAAYRFASALWGPREGFTAAILLAFFQTFYFPNAVLTLEPDTLLIVPHILAVYFAWRGRPMDAGIAAGIAFLLHPKAIFIAFACATLIPGGWHRMALGFLLPNVLLAVWLVSSGAWSAYVEQVWRWGLLYAAHRLPEPASAPWLRLAGWCGFHATLLMGALWQWRTNKDGRLRWIPWLAVSLIAAGVGLRFTPRYLNFLLPPLVIAASYGMVQWWTSQKLRWPVSVALAVALAIPVIRFGPRYISLAAENFAGAGHTWADVRMDQESRAGAAAIRTVQRPSDTIFVWGYRPNVVVYTRLPVAGRMWESQPVTGVPADRHLGSDTPLDAEWAARNRQDLIATTPTILVDGLSAYNPKLDLRNFPDLAAWFSRYCTLSSAQPGLRIYRLCAPGP